MERFVFVAAIAVAILFGLGAIFGGPHFRFSMEFDDGPPEAVVEVAPGRMEAQTYQGDSLDIRHVAALITITPEDRSDFLVEIDNQAGRAPMPTVATDGSSVVIDGRLRGRIGDCHDDGGADLRGYGELAAADLPRIAIRAPRDLSVGRGGAGTTEIGPAQSLSLEVAGCSMNAAADVAGDLEVDLAGSGSVRAGAANTLDASVAGSGSVTTGAIAAGAEVEIKGSGEVTLASLSGDLNFEGAGSGTFNVQAGSVSDAEVEVMGSGGAAIAAAVQSLSIDIRGSGDVIIAAEVRSLSVDIVGSGSVDAATVGDLDADIAGSGNVRVQSVTGSAEQEVWGSGGVTIVNRAPQPPAPTPPAPPAQSAPAAEGENAP
jgi:hypothetical protein